MTHAQQIYLNASQRDFALNFKSYSPELKQELTHIHRIQTGLSKLNWYSKHPEKSFDNEQRLHLSDHIRDLVEDYGLQYGSYELNTVKHLADLGLTTTYHLIQPLV